MVLLNPINVLIFWYIDLLCRFISGNYICVLCVAAELKLSIKLDDPTLVLNQLK